MYYFGHDKGEDNWGFALSENVFNECKEVSDNDYKEIVSRAREVGKRIVGDENGDPILADYPEPDPQEQKLERINELERFLKSTDWYAIRFADTGEEMPADIKKQRQDARDEISRLRNK